LKSLNVDVGFVLNFILQGNLPAMSEQKRSWLSSLRSLHRQGGLGLETLATPWCRLLSQYSQVNFASSYFSFGGTSSLFKQKKRINARKRQEMRSRIPFFLFF